MLYACIAVIFVLVGWCCHMPILVWLCVAFYIGREHAQAEYRWIDACGDGRRENMPWWGGCDPRVWNRKSLLDWLLPAVVVLVAEVFATTMIFTVKAN